MSPGHYNSFIHILKLSTPWPNFMVRNITCPELEYNKSFRCHIASQFLLYVESFQSLIHIYIYGYIHALIYMQHWKTLLIKYSCSLCILYRWYILVFRLLLCQDAMKYSPSMRNIKVIPTCHIYYRAEKNLNTFKKHQLSTVRFFYSFWEYTSVLWSEKNTLLLLLLLMISCCFIDHQKITHWPLFRHAVRVFIFFMSERGKKISKLLFRRSKKFNVTFLNWWYSIIDYVN